MKKIYNIPVYKDAERLSAYLEGNLSKEERRQIELDIQNDSELAELAIDDISVDWDADISDDYPDFDWQNDGELDELMDLFDANEPNDPFEFDDEDLEDIIDDDEIESVLDEKQEDVDGIGDEDYIDNTDDQDDDDDPSDDDETDLDDDY